MKKNKNWYDYLWIVSIVYFLLGFINILFAWLGLIFFFLPILFALFGGEKIYCNKYCDRSKLLNLVGKDLKLSKYKDMPNFLRSKTFRYAFFIFFMFMFFNMLFFTFLVFKGEKNFSSFITLFWSFKIPWKINLNNSSFPKWIYQFSLGFYSMMLTSGIIGIIMSILYKPRAWCGVCPMGTMTHIICNKKYKSKID